jgi:large subunit ribosomal protein L22
MESVAKTKYLKGSPQKARLVIDLVRGKNVSKALAILQFTNKRAAGPISQCIRSAIANATYKAEQDNIAIDPEDLWVKRCFVDMGPTKNRRRLRPAPQGRAYFERRHYCHITIELTSEPLEDPESEKVFEKKARPPKAEKKVEPTPEKVEEPTVAEDTPEVAPEAAAPEVTEETAAVETVEAKTEEATETEIVDETADAPAETESETPEDAPADEKKAEADDEGEDEPEVKE